MCVCVCVCVRERKTRSHHKPCPKHNRKCNGFNGNCFSFNGNDNGVYWYMMDYIGGMLNPVGKMPKTHYKK